jgi:hypothetical protein
MSDNTVVVIAFGLSIPSWYLVEGVFFELWMNLKQEQSRAKTLRL